MQKASSLLKIARDIAQPAAGSGGLAGVDEGNSPGLSNALVDLHSVFLHVEGHIGHMEEVVRKVFFDQIALVAAADDEVVDLVLGIDLEDVPEDRPATDFDHRLGTRMCLFAEPRAKTAGKDNCFHFIPLLPTNSMTTRQPTTTWYVGCFP